MDLTQRLAIIQNNEVGYIWSNTLTLYAAFSEYLQKDLCSLLISMDYDVSQKALEISHFLKEMDIFINPKPNFVNMRSWVVHFSGLWTGINYNSERENPVCFYTWLQLKPIYNKFYFEEYSDARKMRESILKLGWKFDFKDNYWIIVKYKPIEELILNNKTWKTQLEGFYTRSLNELNSYVFDIKTWGL